MHPHDLEWYGLGFTNTSVGIRDIMSYGKECDVFGIQCERIGYFSNPRILIQGEPFGIPKIADGVSKIREKRVSRANFRAAVTEPDPPNFTLCKEVKEAVPTLEKCVIATAAYGSPLERDVKTLRVFRDKVLMKNAVGRALVRFYYELSPALAEIIASRPWLRTLTRGLLWPVVFAIKYPVLAFAWVGFVGVFGVFVFLRKRRFVFAKAIILVFFSYFLIPSSTATAAKAVLKATPGQKTRIASALVYSVFPDALTAEAHLYSGAETVSGSEKISIEETTRFSGSLDLKAKDVIFLSFYYMPDMESTYKQPMHANKSASYRVANGDLSAALGARVDETWTIGLSYRQRKQTVKRTKEFQYGPPGTDDTTEMNFYGISSSMKVWGLLLSVQTDFVQGRITSFGATGNAKVATVSLGYIDPNDEGIVRLEGGLSYSPEAVGTDGSSENIFYWNETIGFFAGFGATLKTDQGLIQNFHLNLDFEAEHRKPLAGQNSSEIRVMKWEVGGGTRFAERGYIEAYTNLNTEEFMNKKFNERELGLRLSCLF